MSKLICLKCRAQAGRQTADDARKLAKEHKMQKGELVYFCGKCNREETLYYFGGYGKKGIREELALDAGIEKMKQEYHKRAGNFNEHYALKQFAQIGNRQ